MNTIILSGADTEQSETEHSPAHQRKRDLLVRNASHQGSAPSSMVLMNGGSALHRRKDKSFGPGHGVLDWIVESNISGDGFQIEMIPPET